MSTRMMELSLDGNALGSNQAVSVGGSGASSSVSQSQGGKATASRKSQNRTGFPPPLRNGGRPVTSQGRRGCQPSLSHLAHSLTDSLARSLRLQRASVRAV